MKILLTGFTQRMVNSQRLVYDYVTSVFILRQALVALGHKVDHAVPPAELSGYDLALVGVGPTKSFTARHVAGCARIFAAEIPVILYCDDWSVEKVGTDFRNTLRNWVKYVKFFNELGRPFTASDEKNVPVMLRTVLENQALTLLAPMFPWGNHKMLMERNFSARLVTWDPSPLVTVPSYKPVPAAERARRWVCATLSKHDDWLVKQNLGWPVAKYGNRRTEHGYLAEKDLLGVYAASWGVLCPAYARAGSGWWRVRYHWAAQLKTVLRADARDTAYMGEPYRLPAAQVESFSLAQLQRAAQQQHDWFFSQVSTRKDTLDRLREVIVT